jgi:hypothetical protein
MAVKWLRWLLPVAALWLLAFIIIWHGRIWWWIEIHTGTVNESGPYYGFWSGFGSDLGEYVILGAVLNGIYVHWKNVNCHDPHCLRIGLYQAAGGQYRLCRHHHPDLMGSRPTLGLIHRHHREHVAANRAPSGNGEGVSS